MGNIVFFSSRKNVSDEQLVEKLEALVAVRFPNNVIEVRPLLVKGEVCSWVVGPKEELCGKSVWQHELEFYRYGPRKFGTKYPHSDWGTWLMWVVLNNMAFQCNGRVSDESDNVKEVGDPNKHTTYRAQLNKARVWRVELHGEKNGNHFSDVHEEAICSNLPEELVNL